MAEAAWDPALMRASIMDDERVRLNTLFFGLKLALA